MSIWVTGDIHGCKDIGKLFPENWPEGKNLTKKDYVIICGDFGLLWHNIPDSEEIYWLKWLNNMPFTTLVVDGNHENHWRLRSLSTTNMLGSIVGVISDSVFHLRRGEIYNIEEKLFFCMGGAQTIDMTGRLEGVSWWRNEIPSYSEIEYGVQNIEKHNNKVDYILAHTLPFKIKGILYNKLKSGRDPTTVDLQLICDITEFKRYYCGHFHDDQTFDKYTILYRRIERIEES